MSISQVLVEVIHMALSLWRQRGIENWTQLGGNWGTVGMGLLGMPVWQPRP